jgi:hypothetical protein
MMRHLNLDTKMKFSREELLTVLKENRLEHKQIVKEAVEGYIKAAADAVANRLAELRKGKCVSLTFHLNPPVDQSEAYDTIIEMLEMSKDTEIELCASEFRQLVMDEWDWMDTFLAQNKLYSATAMTVSAQKGI